MATKFNTEKLIGFVLIACVILSLIIANSPLSEYFFSIMHFDVPVGIGRYKLEKSVEHWINDGLMSIFFLLAGIEIKRELMHGELSEVKKAALPVIAAIGGMTVPAMIFLAFNFNKVSVQGWAIPMATDIAFAIGIMALVGKYAPPSLRIFLIALAIVDDIGAIIVIALFYSTHIDFTYLLLAAGVMIFLIAMNRLNVSRIFFYVLPGILLWFLVYKSGIHATISGVLLAFTIPYETNKGSRLIAKLEHALLKPVYFIVLPLFALVNTAIILKPEAISQIVSPLGIGIFAGLFLGKPLGIVSFSLLGIRSGLVKMPHKTTVHTLIAAGCLAGIGFTMSIFIALLSFNDAGMHDTSKMAILIASTFSALTGYILFYTSKQT